MNPETVTLIHSHLDGRLSAAETERLGELIRDDAAVAAAFAEASRLNHMLREAVKEDFRASLHARRMGGAGGRRLREGEEGKPASKSPARRLVRQLAIAACLALFLGGMAALLTTGTPGSQGEDSSGEKRPSSLAARAAGARGPFLQPVGPAKADALLRKRLRQFVLPDPGVKSQPAQAALAALVEKWSTLPQADETWAKTITFSIAPEVTEAWKTASSEPKVTLEIPGTSLHANLELLAAQADLKVTTSEQGVRLVAGGMSDAEKRVEIRGSVELAALERFRTDAHEQVRALFKKGLACFDVGRFEEAETTIKRVLELDPFNTAARRQLERIRRELETDRLLSGRDHTRPPVIDKFAIMRDGPLSDDLATAILAAAEEHRKAGRDTEAYALSWGLIKLRPDHDGAARFAAAFRPVYGARMPYFFSTQLGEAFQPILDRLEGEAENAREPLLKTARQFKIHNGEAGTAPESPTEPEPLQTEKALYEMHLSQLIMLKSKLEDLRSVADQEGLGVGIPEEIFLRYLTAAGLNVGLSSHDGHATWTLNGTRRELRISNAIQAAIQESSAAMLVAIRVLEYPEDASPLPSEPATTSVLSAGQVQAEFKRPGLKAVGFMLEESAGETRVTAKRPVAKDEIKSDKAAGRRTSMEVEDLGVEGLEKALDAERRAKRGARVVRADEDPEGVDAAGEGSGLETGFEVTILTRPEEGHRVRVSTQWSSSWLATPENREQVTSPQVKTISSSAELNLLPGTGLCVPIPESEDAQSKPRRFLFVTLPD